MNRKFSLVITICCLLVQYIAPTDNILNKSDWWKEVSQNANVTDYVPSGTIRFLLNSTISSNEYWYTNRNQHRLNNDSENNTETYNEIVNPENIGLLGQNGDNMKIIRKIKRTFKKQTNDRSNEELTNKWKTKIVEPSITLDRNSPDLITTSSPIMTLQKASTSHFIRSAAKKDGFITSKFQSNIKWDDDNEAPLTNLPTFKTKKNNQENIYENYASIMPLPPPDTQSTGSPTIDNSIENSPHINENSNNLESSSHHSIAAPPSTSNKILNFNSKIIHSQSLTESSDDSKKNQNKKLTRNTRNKTKNKSIQSQNYFMQAEKSDKKLEMKKKTIDFSNQVKHEIAPKTDFLAHLLKNNPFAIPLGKRTYKITKKGSITPALSLTPFILTKRMQPIKHITTVSTKSNNNHTAPISILSNHNSDNIRFETTPSEQGYAWGRRVQSNLKTNQQKLSKRNEWSDSDEQKESISDKFTDDVESYEESVENDENTIEDIEPINDVNNEFNKNLVAIRNEELPEFKVLTFETPNKLANGNQLKGNLKSLPVKIISWKQAINHDNNDKNITRNEKKLGGEYLTNAKLIISNRPAARKEHQIERDRQSLNNFSAKLLHTSKSPSYTNSVSNSKPPKTTFSPKIISTIGTSSLIDNHSNRRASKAKRNQSNSSVTTKKNQAYIAPSQQNTNKKTKSEKLLHEYEEEKEKFEEELDKNTLNRQTDSNLLSKKENHIKYSKNQEFRKKSLNLIENKNTDNSIDEINDETETTKPIPQTSFKCQEPGYFADQETECTVFHICQENNRKDSFFCPPGTAFNQLLSVCDWLANVNCETSIKPKSVTNTNIEDGVFDRLNVLKNNNYESDDSLEDQLKK